MKCDYVDKFEDLLSNHFGKNFTICVTHVSDLTQPGENYMSHVLKVDVNVKNTKMKEDTDFHLVVKAMRKGINEEMVILPKSMFGKEITFYSDILPTIGNFLIESDAVKYKNLFTKCICYRRNLNGNEGNVDENAVLVLENLQLRGYFNIDRIVGFDLEGAKLIVSDLAKFHGITLSLKLKKPEVYKTKIKKHCFQTKFTANKTLKHICSEQWLDVVLNQDKCLPYREQLKKKFDIEFERMDTFFKRPETEPWATLIHNDMWTNNTMQISENEKLGKNIFVDFQAYIYGSPLCDLVFFIWSSVQIKVIQEHSEELCQHYHRQLVSVLEEFGCDTTPFAYREFLKQLDKDAPHELFHVLYIAALIYADKGTQAIDLSNEVTEFMSGPISKIAAERIEFVVQDFGRRGWIVY